MSGRPFSPQPNLRPARWWETAIAAVVLVVEIALVVLVVGWLVGCSAPTGQHWPRGADAETVVYLVVPLEAPTDVRTAADLAARDWSLADGLRMPMINRCPVELPAPVNCVPLIVDPAMPPGHGVTWRAASGLIITGATVTVGSADGVCHEVGHALGLTHGYGPGPCENNRATDWDRLLIGQAYT